MLKKYKPFFEQVSKNETSRIFEGRYITFYNVGTYSVKINGLILLPGDIYTREVNTIDNAVISYTPSIEFIEETTTTAENKRLTQGKKIIIESLKL